jgi:hypothetical protein
MEKTIRVKMYYDEYEKYFGDGFYPFFKEKEEKDENSEVIFSFRYNNDCWNQITQDEIYGLDGNVGKQLLERLNSSGQQNGKIIKNSNGFIIYRVDE